MDLKRLQAKWDALAAPQLREEVERLETELRAMTARAERAERYAERLEIVDEWQREEALERIRAAGLQPGLTREGFLVGVAS